MQLESKLPSKPPRGFVWRRVNDSYYCRSLFAVSIARQRRRKSGRIRGEAKIVAAASTTGNSKSTEAVTSCSPRLRSVDFPFSNSVRLWPPLAIISLFIRPRHARWFISRRYRAGRDRFFQYARGWAIFAGPDVNCGLRDCKTETWRMERHVDPLWWLGENDDVETWRWKDLSMGN